MFPVVMVFNRVEQVHYFPVIRQVGLEEVQLLLILELAIWKPEQEVAIAVVGEMLQVMVHLTIPDRREAHLKVEQIKALLQDTMLETARLLFPGTFLYV